MKVLKEEAHTCEFLFELAVSSDFCRVQLLLMDEVGVSLIFRCSCCVAVELGDEEFEDGELVAVPD